MRKTSVAAILLLCTVSLPAQQAKKKNNPNSPNPEGAVAADMGPLTIAGEISGDRVSDPGKQGDWPAITSGSDGSEWAIWIEWNDKDADRVLVSRRPGNGAWQAAMEIRDGNWDHYSPTIVALPDGVMALWSGQSDGNFDLFSATISNEGKISRPERLTTARFSDFNARAVSDAAGNVTVVWQSFRNLNGDVFARRYSKRWGPETRISEDKAKLLFDDWDPAVALDRNGTAWISWDGYKTGNYDVYLRSFDGRPAKPKLGNVIAITTEPAAQFHTSVAVDDQDRVWVAWDEADQNWGKDFSKVSAAHRQPRPALLAQDRVARIRQWAGAGSRGGFECDPGRPGRAVRGTSAPFVRFERRALDGLPPLDVSAT